MHDIQSTRPAKSLLLPKHAQPSDDFQPIFQLYLAGPGTVGSGWAVETNKQANSVIQSTKIRNPELLTVVHGGQSASSGIDIGGREPPPLADSACTTLHLVSRSPNVVPATPAKRTGKSMSRRTGQSGHIEESGKWWVVRWWMDVAGQEKRVHKRARICPVSGPGVLSRSARERRAREIIAKSGADTEEYFNKVVKQEGGITFREQAVFWFEQVKTRKRKPVAISTLELWEGCLRKWLNPQIGDIPLSEVNNAALKGLVATMSEGGLSAKTIDNYVLVVKMVVASAVDKEGEEIYPRKWNPDFIDMPLVLKAKQNTPCFSPEVMSGLAAWKYERERMVFILCGATGLRIGEALGLEIDKHISPDFLTISIEQKVRHGKVEERLKTASALRKVDIHPTIAAMLQEFVGERESGFLFCTRNGRPLGSSNILRRHLHPALKQLGFINPFTGTSKAGSHAFRRFRNTFLRNHTDCPEGLQKFWMGHAGESMTDLYDKIKEDEMFRREWAERCGFGFKLPSVVPNVPKMEENEQAAEAA
jgi:integrase